MESRSGPSPVPLPWQASPFGEKPRGFLSACEWLSSISRARSGFERARTTWTDKKEVGLARSLGKRFQQDQLLLAALHVPLYFTWWQVTPYWHLLATVTKQNSNFRNKGNKKRCSCQAARQLQALLMGFLETKPSRCHVAIWELGRTIHPFITIHHRPSSGFPILFSRHTPRHAFLASFFPS